MNNSALEETMLGNLAKYRERYGVKLYAFAIEANHMQFPAQFPEANRAHFMRDLNSSSARAVSAHVPEYTGGRLWGRRYSAEYLPGDEDIEEQFFYTVLQAVLHRGAKSIYEYQEYNCFEDAIHGRARKYKVIRWKEYNDARRWNKDVPIEKFTDWYDLKFTRLPGYEHLSQGKYVRVMRKKLEARTAEIIRDRGDKPAMGAAARKKVKPGSLPKETKTSDRYDHRPRVLTKDNERRARGKEWYFEIYSAHREASKAYRKGDLLVKFPKGTYKPPLFTVAYNRSIV